MQKQLEWDDLEYVLAVGRSRTLSGAAKTLGVNHSTVFRRIGAVEARLSVRLFDRQREGFSPTPAGEAMIEFAEEIDARVTALERRLAGEDLKPQGTVRLTASDTLAQVIISIIPKFQHEYPQVRLELVTGNQILSLSRRDADIALRATTSPEANLYGRKLATIAFAVYGSAEYLARAGNSVFSRDHSWIGLDDSLSSVLAYKWLNQNALADRITFTASSFTVVLNAVSAGIGLAVIPCYMTKGLPLVRCSPVLPEVATDLWMLVHEDLRNTTRVRALMDFITAELTALRTLFEQAE